MKVAIKVSTCFPWFRSRHWTLWCFLTSTFAWFLRLWCSLQRRYTFLAPVAFFVCVWFASIYAHSFLSWRSQHFLVTLVSRIFLITETVTRFVFDDLNLSRCGDYSILLTDVASIRTCAPYAFDVIVYTHLTGRFNRLSALLACLEVISLEASQRSARLLLSLVVVHTQASLRWKTLIEIWLSSSLVSINTLSTILHFKFVSASLIQELLWWVSLLTLRFTHCRNRWAVKVWIPDHVLWLNLTAWLVSWQWQATHVILVTLEDVQGWLMHLPSLHFLTLNFTRLSNFALLFTFLLYLECKLILKNLKCFVLSFRLLSLNFLLNHISYHPRRRLRWGRPRFWF